MKSILLNLLWIILGVMALIVIVFLLRVFFKRLHCRFSIRRHCRKHGLTFRAAHPLWWLGSRYLKGCDFIIEGNNEVLAVKLFGCFWPLKSLILREYGEYCFRAHANLFKFILDVFDGYPHPLPEYRFPEPGSKPQRNMLLICPAPLDMHLQPSSGVEEVTGPGDVLRGMELASLPHLLRIAENTNRVSR